MATEVKVPALPESVADATIAAWHKKPGEQVLRDENLVDLETDKVVLEVPSPVNGVLATIFFKQGQTVTANQILASIEETTPQVTDQSAATPITQKNDHAQPTSQAEAVTSQTEPASKAKSVEKIDHMKKQPEKATGPAVRRLLAEHELQPKQITGSGKAGRIHKEDVESFITSTHDEISTAPKPLTTETTTTERQERSVPMTRLRAKIAERLVAAQHNAAMLTTFNEINLKAVIDLRSQYKDSFAKKYNIKLGFMSFFAKAVVHSLKKFPAINASIDETNIIYHGYYDLSIAVSTDRGLVVPVIKNIDQMSMASIEQAIDDLATRARLGKLSLEEMQGGTFTITNGGVFGSLLATPIINPPQAAILGMHKIMERPIVEHHQIVIRPMMYVALSYDHRLIDGKESVQFLVSMKESLEDPARLLLEL